MKRQSIRHLILGTASFAAMVSGTSAFAQETTPAAADGQVNQEDEANIVVTAQRRAQNLQDVPIAVSTLTADALAEAGVGSTDQLIAVTPGFTIQRQLGGGTPYIRGIGTQTTAPGIEAAVATYVDGVYYMSPYASIFNFNNVRQIEVLRGPQGTLFGRNATGGLISITTLEPQADPTFRASLSYGNYDTVEGALYASAGTDRIAFDIAGQLTRQQDGYGRNLLTGADVNRRREAGVRSKILWTPVDNLRVVLSADYIANESSLGFNLKPIPGTLSIIGQPPRGTRFDSEAGYPQSQDTNIYGGSVKIEYDFGPVQLSSLSALRYLDSTLFFDQDASPARIVDVILGQRDRTFQQEFLLQGSSGRLNYTAGLFYFRSSASLNPLAVRSISPATNFDIYTDLDTDSYAAFAQGDFELTPTTTVTAGVRYTSDSRDYNGALVAPGRDPTVPANAIRAATASKTFPRLTWRFAVLQELNPDINVYASYSRGFKSGVFNTGTISTAPIAPEIIDAYEAGLRSEFLGRALRFNVSAFLYDYSNIQLNRIEFGNAVLLNAAKGRVYGGEIETSYVTSVGTGELSLNANLSYLHARYTSFPNGPTFTPTGVGGNVQGVADLSGNDMIRSPDFTFSIGGNYSVPIGTNTELQLSANYYHSEQFFWEPENRTTQPAYDLFNAQAAISFADGRFRIRVFGKNLTNAFYYSYVTSSGLGNLGSPADPRTYGIGVDFRF